MISNKLKLKREELRDLTAEELIYAAFPVERREDGEVYAVDLEGDLVPFKVNTKNANLYFGQGIGDVTEDDIFGYDQALYEDLIDELTIRELKENPDMLDSIVDSILAFS